ncbi:MAG: hypothetical protein QXG86_00860 [Candidatus Woesearchaeota archaeon]
MKSKFKKLLNDFSFEELKIIERDLMEGGEIIKCALFEKIQELSNSEKFCATCFRELKNPKYSLIIGTKFKKKVSFCEIDCMQYFVSHLKYLEEEIKN